MFENIPSDFLYFLGWFLSFVLYVLLIGKHKLFGKLDDGEIGSFVLLSALIGCIWLIATPIILAIWYVKKNQ